MLKLKELLKELQEDELIRQLSQVGFLAPNGLRRPAFRPVTWYRMMFYPQTP